MNFRWQRIWILRFIIWIVFVSLILLLLIMDCWRCCIVKIYPVKCLYLLLSLASRSICSRSCRSLLWDEPSQRQRSTLFIWVSHISRLTNFWRIDIVLFNPYQMAIAWMGFIRFHDIIFCINLCACPLVSRLFFNKFIIINLLLNFASFLNYLLCQQFGFGIILDSSTGYLSLAILWWELLGLH